jgi:hypothetical protein
MLLWSINMEPGTRSLRKCCLGNCLVEYGTSHEIDHEKTCQVVPLKLFKVSGRTRATTTTTTTTMMMMMMMMMMISVVIWKRGFYNVRINAKMCIFVLVLSFFFFPFFLLNFWRLVCLVVELSCKKSFKPLTWEFERFVKSFRSISTQSTRAG